MPRSLGRVVLAGAMVCLMAVVTSAQQTSTATDTKSFEVIAVDGNDLVVQLPEGTRQINVPPDFRFTVDGQSLSVSELKPGMKGTAVITTKTTTTPVTVTEVRNGTVAMVSGTNVYVRTADGVRLFTQSEVDKRGIKIMIDGKQRAVSELHTGDTLSATIVTTRPPRVVTEREVQATLAKATSAPAAAAAAVAPAQPAAPAAAATAPPPQQPTNTLARTLPSTAGSLPTVGLVGLASLAIAAALATRRRRAR
jgi:hypothetical protein